MTIDNRRWEITDEDGVRRRASTAMGYRQRWVLDDHRRRECRTTVSESDGGNKLGYQTLAALYCPRVIIMRTAEKTTFVPNGHMHARALVMDDLPNKCM